MGERKAASRTWRSERRFMMIVTLSARDVRPSVRDHKRRYYATQTNALRPTGWMERSDGRTDGIDFAADFQSQSDWRKQGRSHGNVALLVILA